MNSVIRKLYGLREVDQDPVDFEDVEEEYEEGCQEYEEEDDDDYDEQLAFE